MVIRRNKKKILSILLAAAMVLSVAGCGGDGGAAGLAGADGANAGGGTDSQQDTPSKENAGGDGQTAMGRYVEVEYDLSEQLSRPRVMRMMEDGSIVILDANTGVFVSNDQGATWSDDTPDWFTAMKNDQIYITSMDIAPNGTVVVGYNPPSDDNDYNPVAKVILPDGTEVQIGINFTEENKYVKQVVASDEGRIFVDTLSGIYEVHEDGSSEKVLTPEDTDYIWAKGNLLFIDTGWETVEAPTIYDLDAGEYIEDRAIIEFVKENYANRNYNGDDYGTMYLMPGDDGAVYVLGSKGIHRHVIGGNMMEQIVDGNLSMLGNPNYSIVSVIQPEENVFLILCTGGKLLRLTYDPDVPSVPENMITIYSLREDEKIRQAISLYQTQHPDTFVSYEIGMGEGDAVTREDAVKRLNTEIMAGSGPDLIVLDDLPISSYVDKGLLLDITDYLAQYSAKEPLFDNIIEAMKIDGKAYMAPVTIGLPMMAVSEEYTAKMTDLSGVGDVVEELRAEHPGENIIGMCSPVSVMKRFAATSAPKWIKADGTLDLESIGEYLEQCKRIYDAQMDGLDANIVQYYADRAEAMAAYLGSNEYTYNEQISRGVLNYISRNEYLLPGWADNANDYIEVMSLDKTKGFEDAKVISMEGQCSNVFRPSTILGINAASGRIDAAKGFMDTFLSAASMQNVYDGFPLNQEAFDIQFTPNKEFVWGENGEYLSWSTSDADGNGISYQTYWPTNEQIAELKSQIASLNTAYIPDSVLEKAVFDSGVEYMRYDRDLESILTSIERALAIYMAE